jgi:hypothetical protein
MSLADWNAICRAEGWALTRNQGQAARMAGRKSSAIMSARVKPVCGFTGCGRWVAAGETHCLEHSGQLATTPF